MGLASLDRRNLDVDNDGLSEAAPGPATVMIASWVLVSVATATVGARLYLRLGIQGRGLIMGDYIICMACICAITTNIMNSVLSHFGALDKHVMATLEGYNGNPDNTALIIKLFWGSHFLLWTTFYLCKVALVTAYYNLFVTLMNKLKYILWGTIFYIAVAYIVSILFLICICESESHWNLSLPGNSCVISFGRNIFVDTWALHFAGDVLVFSLPWLIIPKIPLKTSLRVGLYLTFGFGIVSMVFCIIRLTTLETSQVGNNISLGLMVLWNGLEGNLSVIVACLPSLRPYFGDQEASRNMSRSRKSWTRTSISKPWRKCNNTIIETRDKLPAQPVVNAELSPTLKASDSENGQRTRSNSDEVLVNNESA